MLTRGSVPRMQFYAVEIARYVCPLILTYIQNLTPRSNRDGLNDWVHEKYVKETPSESNGAGSNDKVISS
jgi:hypothetical protein